MRFTVRRPASAEVSPCCHRPSGGDVACGVDVGVAPPRIAGDALENRLALAVLRRDVPAARASLRRIRCRDEFQPLSDFMLQSGDQQSPALAADLAVEAPFLRDPGARAFTSPARRAGHRTHLQVLNFDGVEAARHIGGGFFHKVTAAICFTGAQLRDGQFRSCRPSRSALPPSQTPLQSAKPFGLAGTKARSAEQLPAGQGNRDRYAAINSDDAAIAGSRYRVGEGGKSDVPAPRAIQGDPIRFHGVGDGARPAEAHPPDLGYPYLPVAAVEPFNVARSYTDLPEPFILAGFAPRGATVGAVKEVSHRLGEVPQRLLLHGLRPACQPFVFGAGRSQLGTLLVVPGRLATWLPVPLLLDGEIPHKPSMTTVLAQCRRLLKTGKQPKPAHSNNLGSTTDNQTKGGKRRLVPRPKPGVSAPQR